MWQCKQCFYKNNNSTKKCHGDNCKALRDLEAYELPIKIIKEAKKKDPRVYDFCPNCRKDTFWLPRRYEGKKAWSCTVCYKIAILKGKSKPFPEEIKNAEIR